jgi:hypothetical protein
VRLRRSWEEILEQLRAEGVALPAPAPAIPEGPAEASESPWFVRALLGVGAWVAALFALGSIGVAAGGLGAFVPMGALALAAGVGLLRVRAGEFVRQLGLACSLAGQLALAIGLADEVHDTVVLAAVALVAEGLLARLVADPIHRFSSTLLAATAATALLLGLHVPAPFDLAVLILAAGVGLFWVRQPDRLRAGGVDPWTPVGYGLALALFGVLLFALLGGVLRISTVLGAEVAMGRLASGGLGLATVALALRISTEAGVPRPTPLHAAGLGALALIGLVSPGTPGVAAAAGVLLLGLHRRNPLLAGLAIVFLIAFLGLLYYSLAASLLVKALHLVIAGTVLLAAAWRLRRKESR